MDSTFPHRRTRLASLPRWALATIALAASTAAVAQAASALARTLTLSEAVQIATAQSRKVAATRLQVQAAQEMAVAAGQRPDPVLKAGLNNLPIDGADRFSVTRDFMTMRSIGVMQELTGNDKRRARSERAEREADMARAGEREVTAGLQRDVALSWLERSFQQSMRELLIAQQAQADAQVLAAEALYRGGKGAQADVFAARSEVEKGRDRIAQADRMLAVATTQLTRWIGEAASRPNDARPVFEMPAWTLGDLPAHLAGHPMIDAAARREAVAQADVQVASTGKHADWSVELMFSQRGPAYSNMVSVNFSVPLQWDQRQRQDREIAAKQALASRAQAEREDLQRAHEADVRTMLLQWRSDEERLHRYDTRLIPLAQQRSDAALTAYRSGSGTLPNVLDARRSEIETRMDRLRIEIDIARLWAELVYLVPQADTIDGVAMPGSTQ